MEKGADDAVGLEAALDALYAADPQGFVAGRDRLAGELRRAGRRDEARRVAALRRPTVAAWAVDHLALRTPDAVDALVAAGERLREAHEAVVAGADPLVLHRAAEERRALIASMADEAVAVLARRGGGDAGAHREEIEATLEAASVDASVAALVRSGRLAAPVPRRVGFAGLLDLPLPSAPAPVPDEAEDQRTRDEDVERRREEAARLARAVAEAAADADRARSQLDAAIARVERLEGELAEARARLAAAREEAGQAGARERAAREAAAAANPTGTSEHSSMGGPSSGEEPSPHGREWRGSAYGWPASKEDALLYAFAFDHAGVVVSDLYFVNPRPEPGQEGPEQGVRLEVRLFERGELRGSIYSARPIAVERPIWRADLLESVANPGTLDRAHHHPRFDGWEPGRRHFVDEMSADPVGWVGARLAHFEELLAEAGVARDEVGPNDADEVRGAAGEIMSAVDRLLRRVRGGELGGTPDGGVVGSTRLSWL